MTHPLFDRRPAIAGKRLCLAAIVLAVAGLSSPTASAAEDEATIRRTAELINNIRSRLDACGDEGMLAVSTAAAPAARKAVASRSIAARPRLTWNPVLAETARRHSESMATDGYFDHVDSQGRTVGARARDAGYRYRVVGENLAAGHATVEEALRGWLLSASHCRNLIDERFTEFGIARVLSPQPNDRYGAYWTLVLGVQQGTQVATAR
ncbi:MAG: CAP domain-containing protein [Burkholderiaceae bacterium]|nr:CAP domain-containing protein [Burkholderiaceae bacterium]MEB2320156.1 CAP domain-containing protein [Pseudomonadota bacterium]